MNKKIKVLVIVAILIVSCVTVWATHNRSSGEQVANEIGLKARDSAMALMDKSSNEISSFTVNSEDTIATVMGEDVSKEYFLYRMSLYEACGYDNAAQDAWELIKKQLFERDFAQKHNLLPSEMDIAESTNQLRELAASTEESDNVIKALITSMGLSEEEFWNTFKPKYETTPVLITENVLQYCVENGLPELDLSAVEYEIVNTEFFDELEIGY